MEKTELESYFGISPKPSDFDSYWDKKISLLDNVPLNYALQETEFSNFENISYYDLTFESFDGAKIYAKYLRPKTSKKVPVLFYFHGYPGCNRNWFEKSSYVSLGYAVVALDFRGQGGRSEDVGGVVGTTVAGHIVTGLDGNVDDMLFVKNILDVCLLLKIVRTFSDVDVSNFNCAGGSQGGAFATTCAALNPDIKKCIIQYPFLSDMKKVYELDLDEVAYEGIRYYTRWFNATGENDENFFNKLGYIDSKNFAPRIKANVLFAASGVDLICPIETQYAVYNNIVSDKRLVLYQKFGHENMPDFNKKIMEFLLEDKVCN